jgi:uncharacterized NAD(P)/FAD-binding protein YdhS
MTKRDAANKTIAIIGGGASGALSAYHLLQQHVHARVIVIDPRPELGLGLAYSTPSLRHLLNVPAGKISAIPQQPDHFLNWLRANHDVTATEMTFAPRAVFGHYLQSLLRGTCGLQQEQASVVDLRRSGCGAVLTLDDRRQIKANLVVLATGNFDPATMRGISDTAIRSGAYRHNAWDPETYKGLSVDAPVVLVGTGLTGVDVVLRLRKLGHRGIITAASRRGILPDRHAPYAPMRASAIAAETPATCVAYLRALRIAIRNGADWRAAFDSLRAHTNDLWLALPLIEQKRFRRHLQRRWDVARHRMAPLVADAIEEELRAGTLAIRAGHLASVEVSPAGAMVTIRNAEGTQAIDAARVINCTGPSMDYRSVDSPLISSLFAQGLICPGALGGGILTAKDGATVDVAGHVSDLLFNLGPGRLGTLLESIAVPEIRSQAVELAAVLSQAIEEQKHCEGVPSGIVATASCAQLSLGAAA